jgi:hypothetical protein
MHSSPAAAPLNFFRSLRQKHYELVWQSLSSYSQQVFIETLYASLKPATTSLERLYSDFEKGKGWARTYWNDFAQNVKLDTWLSQKYQAYGDSDQRILVRIQPANMYLLVTKEAGEWRFGYFESFRDNQ